MNKITFQYSNENIKPLDDNITAVIESVINQVLLDQGVEVNVDIAVTLSDNNDIREINKNYRDIDSDTDVLSFPMLEYEKPGAIFASAEDFEDDKLLLGDIVISVEKAYAQAHEYGHSVEREFGFLAAHSVLHLLGYDHMTQEDEKVMIEKQELSLEKLNLTR
ncbi:MAG: rRNA maturation RNase YbeY [Bacillota bacterium]|nr:rRNA maturation RNase YbeY [Bacillota bacterium]